MALLFPAHAGVIPGKSSRLIFVDSFPRPCGGDPMGSTSYLVMTDFSPPTRG